MLAPMTISPPDSAAAGQRRAACPACLRPAATCICGCASRVATDTALLILQHPLEVRQAKGSARLLHLCIPGSVLLTGETFDPTLLADALHGDGRQPLLLYPQTDPLAPAPLQLDDVRGQGGARRLVLLDGTWRKSRKMLHLNPQLAALPRLALRAMPPSAYRIRKAHAPHQLSSFEAAAYALMGLQGEGGDAGLDRLLASFDDFIVQQARFLPVGA